MNSRFPMPTLRLFVNNLSIGGVQWLAANHQVHWGEQILLGTLDQHISSKSQVISRLVGSWWRNADLLKTPNKLMHKATSELGHAGDGWEIPERLHILEVSSNRVVPWSNICAFGQILVVDELETSGLNGADALGDGNHIGDTVALLNTDANLAVADVVDVVAVGHQPLVNTKDTTWLKSAVDLAVDALEGLSVDGGLNGVDGIESLVGELHLL